MIHPEPELRDERALDVPHRLLRRDGIRGQYMHFVNYSRITRNNSNRQDAGKRGNQLLGLTYWQHTTRDCARWRERRVHAYCDWDRQK